MFTSEKHDKQQHNKGIVLIRCMTAQVLTYTAMECSTAKLLWDPEGREGDWARSIPIAVAVAVTIAAVVVSVPMPLCTENASQWLSLHRCLQHSGYAHSCHFPSDALVKRCPCTLQESIL